MSKPQDPWARINPKHQAFADEYLRHWNATRAYKSIHPQVTERSAWQSGSRLLRNEKVAAYINQKLESRAMGLKEILARLGDMARGDIGHFVDEDGILRLTLADAKSLGLTHLIKRVRQKRRMGANGIEEEELWVELHDPQAAMDKILRVLGAYAPEQHKLMGPGGEPLAAPFMEAIALIYGSKPAAQDEDEDKDDAGSPG